MPGRRLVGRRKASYVQTDMEPMTPQQAAPTIPRTVLVAAAGGAGLLVAATIALWAYYGQTIFFEMILAGVAACF